MSLIKDIVLWRYERASWQWDVLCILIVIFIFATPKSWFDKKDDLQPKREPAPSKTMIYRPDFNEKTALIKTSGQNT